MGIFETFGKSQKCKSHKNQIVVQKNPKNFETKKIRKIYANKLKKSCTNTRLFVYLYMKTKEKTSVATVAVSNPTEKAEMKVLNSNKIEEAQVIEPQTQMPKPNLEQTSKIITELHTKIRHLTRLEFYINELEQFEVAHVDEDLTKSHYSYQGCLLKLTDDKRLDFELKNPVIISEVVEFLNNRLVAKRSELEAEIVLP